MLARRSWSLGRVPNITALGTREMPCIVLWWSLLPSFFTLVRSLVSSKSWIPVLSQPGHLSPTSTEKVINYFSTNVCVCYPSNVRNPNPLRSQRYIRTCVLFEWTYTVAFQPDHLCSRCSQQSSPGLPSFLSYSPRTGILTTLRGRSTVVFPFCFLDGCLHDFPSSLGKYAWVGLSLAMRDLQKFWYYVVLFQRVKISASFFLGTGKKVYPVVLRDSDWPGYGNNVLHGVISSRPAMQRC